MNNQYAKSEEKFVKSVVFYAKDTSDGYLYADEDQTETVCRADLLNLCMKGLVLISYKGAIHTPIYFKDSGTVVTVTIATAISASASASLDLKSKEPEA